MRGFATLIMLALSSAAHAELRPFCASRPGLGTPPCTVDPGRVVVEVGLADWTLENSTDERKDTLLAGDVSVRVGVGPTTELQVGWTAYGQVRTRDKTSGATTRASGSGDITLGVRQSLSGPDGGIAIQPFVTLPVGGNAIGAGDWGAGVVLPIGFDLGRDVQLALTPSVEAAVNESGKGRHLAFGSVVGLSAPLATDLSGAIEMQVTRDDDPGGETTQVLASASLAWMVGPDTQIDIGGVAGLNRDSPDAQVYFGIAKRF